MKKILLLTFILTTSAAFAVDGKYCVVEKASCLVQRTFSDGENHGNKSFDLFTLEHNNGVYSIVDTSEIITIDDEFSPQTQITISFIPSNSSAYVPVGTVSSPTNSILRLSIKTKGREINSQDKMIPGILEPQVTTSKTREGKEIKHYQCRPSLGQYTTWFDNYPVNFADEKNPVVYSAYCDTTQKLVDIVVKPTNQTSANQ